MYGVCTPCNRGVSCLFLFSSVCSLQTFAVPQADIHEVLFVFYLPPQFREWRSKPLHWISSLLQYQGPSSLISRLRRLGLATGLSAGYWSPELCTVFQVCASPTNLQKASQESTLSFSSSLLFSLFLVLSFSSASFPSWLLSWFTHRWLLVYSFHHDLDLGIAVWCIYTSWTLGVVLISFLLLWLSFVLFCPF